MPPREKLTRIRQGLGRRALSGGRIAATLAGAGARRLVRSSPDDDAALGEALLEQLDEMKGLAMKAGQILSYMDGVLPPAAAERLRALQAGGRAVELDALRPQIEGPLGGTVEELFEAFDTEPIAAASIGQVHRARFEGRPVAVKIQYPGVADTLRSDLTTLGRLATLGTLGVAVDGAAVVDELRERFLEECDYDREAAWQRAVRARLRVDGVRVPAVIDARSAATVLTTAHSDGARFYDFIADATQAQRDQAGVRLFTAAFTLIFRHGLINADPHPGNYLFEPDATVLLDWGCVRPYPQDFVDTWRQLAEVVLARDRAAFDEVFRRTGMVGDDRFDYDTQWEQMAYLYEPFLTPGFVYDADYVARSYRFVSPRHNPNLRRVAMPPAWVLTQRLHWGLNSVLAHLGARAPWPELFREALAAPWEPIRAEG